jgi:spore germination cell wall hydrolase CwlJ-like protein
MPAPAAEAAPERQAQSQADAAQAETVQPDTVQTETAQADAAPPVAEQQAEAALPSGMDLEFSLSMISRQAEAARPSDMPQVPSRSADSVAELPSGMDLEFSPFAAAQQAEAEILTDEEPVDTDVVVRSEIKPDNPAQRLARLFFGADTLGPTEGRLQPWREGEAPVLMPMHPSVDPDIKRAAIEPVQKNAALKPDAKSEGETVAPKGEVTGEGKRPMTPAERLGLTGSARAKHERCLTNAIYFEARGESERGQMAVAQVVLNRAFSGYYPDNVCGVVYQNSHRHLACQFTFACDNVRDVVTEPDAWEVAKRIARDSLDGKIWLPEIGKATHYHATYVSPWWVRTMKKHKTLGIHIFYRPTRWGDGSEAPAWGPAASANPSVAAARM